MEDKQIIHEFTSEIICPWCGHVHDDPTRMDDGDREDMTCRVCKLAFLAKCYMIQEFSTERR